MTLARCLRAIKRRVRDRIRALLWGRPAPVDAPRYHCLLGVEYIMPDTVDGDALNRWAGGQVPRARKDLRRTAKKIGLREVSDGCDYPWFEDDGMTAGCKVRLRSAWFQMWFRS